MLSQGLLIKINSDLLTVKVNDKYYDCKLRGKVKKIKPLVGDLVLVDINNMTIESILDRKNYLLRPNVANIDVSLIVTSIKEPNINYTLLDKLISIITINHIEPVIVLTKSDLASNDEIKDINKIMKYYENIGIKVFDNINIKKLKNYLSKKIVSVCGQTGAGKSTLINKLDSNLKLETNEISKSLGRGKHTTRLVSLYEVDDFYIIDTPGFSKIDINIYKEEDIRNSFIEFKDKECKFNDCKHICEKGCKVIEEVNNQTILLSRYENYLRFIKE